ncbi:Gar1/Naf1 family protein [Thermococcus stetteri]|uniref:Gar1/Naf1 family protein n=1 Tax=Thermococcus stetteri TaxID=49900 RepID=UPI001AE70052|nr:Gar1/Naf1 family protein [Thermococcus stetteri]MBP1911128.1 RNA-binding protein [Thermococcus stetteri]
MKRLGVVSHYAKQGFLIVRTNWVPSLNEPVVDKELKPIGVVKDVFGPVNYPYVAVKPRVKDPEKYVGAVLYVGKREKGSKKAPRKGRASGKGKPSKNSKSYPEKGKNGKRSGPTPRRRG